MTELEAKLLAIDEDEARWLDVCRDFDEQRKRAVDVVWPRGTRVRWKQTPRRGVFEAEGLVIDVVLSERAVFSLLVRMTKHPSLERRHEVEGSLCIAIRLDELERIET